MTATTKTVTYPMHPELKGLDERQRELYVKIRDLYRSHCLEEAAKRYQIGQLVWQARNARNAYGEHVLLQIAMALSISEKTLYRWSNVAGRFAPETFAELMGKRSHSSGRPITFGETGTGKYLAVVFRHRRGRSAVGLSRDRL